MLKYKSLYIFTVPDRYVTKNKLSLQAAGGKADKSETFKEALNREIKEEIKADIEIYSSNYTTYIHEGGILLSEPFHDNPAPYCIYRRDISSDTRDKRIKWILLFQAEALLNSIDDLQPAHETDTIVCLSQDLLLQLTHPTHRLRIKDVQDSKDGSCIISKNKYKSNIGKVEVWFQLLVLPVFQALGSSNKVN